MRNDIEQIIKLSETTNIMKAIAEKAIAKDGVYYCTYAGKKTAIVK